MPVTQEELAFRLKREFPQLRSIPNAQLVEGVLARRPELASDIVDLQPTQPQPPGPARTLAGATGISETPWYQQPIHTPAIPGVTKSFELPSPEGVAEWLPAAAATLFGAVATRNPAAATALGAAGGEAGRQLFRRAVGASAAPGMVQEATGTDPDSPAAALEGMGGEALASLLGVKASKALHGLSGGAERSAEDSIIRDILGGATSERRVDEATALAKRAQAAGIVGKWSHRGRLARADEVLAPAHAEAKALTDAARAAGTTVEGMPVLHAIFDEAPASIPRGPGGPGGPRRVAIPEQRAVDRLANDTNDVLLNTGGGATGSAVPVDVALGEIKALDEALEPMYKRGALDPAHGKKALQVGRKAWGAQLRAADKELADARLKQHELMTLKEMLQEVVDARLKPRGAHEAVAAASPIVVGRYGPAASSLGKSIGKLAPITIPIRQILAKALSGGASTAQLWLRALDQYGEDDAARTAERNRKAHRALQSQAKGVIP